MLKTEDLHYVYPRGSALSFADINCAQGEHWLLLGASGSGKTTLLHLLAGLRKPGSGSIHIHNQDITQLKGAALDHFRGRHIGIIFQQSHFVQALTVRENLILAQRFAGLAKDEKKILARLHRLGIADKADKKPFQLSVGEQQRASICRALVNGPDVILADEPTSALDDDNCTAVIRLLKEQAAQDKATLLIVTHDGRLKSNFDHQIKLDKQLV